MKAAWTPRGAAEGKTEVRAPWSQGEGACVCGTSHLGPPTSNRRIP